MRGAGHVHEAFNGQRLEDRTSLSTRLVELAAATIIRQCLQEGFILHNVSRKVSYYIMIPGRFAIYEVLSSVLCQDVSQVI